jgi:hypothetical protein
MEGHEKKEKADDLSADLTELKLFVDDDLYRAFQRCVWIRINESGCSQQEIMQEVVHDFLVKYGC